MKLIKSLIIALVLLLTTVSFASAADQPPEPPLIVKGEVVINDEPAPAGTQITAKLDGELIARSTVEKSGEYELHLLKKDDYSGLKITVDGTESQTDSEIADKLNTANPTKATYLDLDVTESSTSEKQVSVSPSTGGGFGSPSGSSTTNQNEDTTSTGGDSETKGTTSGDSSPDASASTGTNGETEPQGSTAPGPEETSSNIVLMVVGAIIIIGIIAAAGYKLKK